MLGWRILYVLSLLLAFNQPASQGVCAVEAGANTEGAPKQILRTGIDVDSSEISSNSRQLADILKLTPLLKRIQDLSGKSNSSAFEAKKEPLTVSQELTSAIVEADHVIQEANFAVDFTLAQIGAEEALYAEMLSSYTTTRDRRILLANAISYITNGILWAVAEGVGIPTYRHPRLSVPSGTVGILAGIIPSLASGYTLYEMRGPKRDSEKDPNMLTKLFDCSAPAEEKYPKPVWDFLSAVPASERDSGATNNCGDISKSNDHAASGDAGETSSQETSSDISQSYSGAVRLGTAPANQNTVSNDARTQAGDNSIGNPAGGGKDEKPKSRRDQLIDRWVADKNIPAFTDPKEKRQVDIITACNSRKKGLTIAMLNARSAMLQQLSVEILKMKRMLLELSMVVHGDKHI